jgi:hypothetical protein
MFTLILTNEENIYIFLLLAQTKESITNLYREKAQARANTQP